MSRRTLVTALTGLVLVAGSGGSALASELAAGLLGDDGDGRTTLCLRTDGPDSPRPEGLCVWVPVEP